MIAQETPWMPLSILAPVCIASFIMLLLYVRRFPDLLTKLLIIIVWLRFTMSAFHPITFPPLIAGLSMNALVSVLAVIACIFVLNLRALSLKYLSPIYFLFAMVLISAFANQDFYSSINTVVKYLFLLVVSLAMFQSMCRHGRDRVLQALLITFVPAITLQWLSFAIGLGKQTEGDGSVSFIGGYYHEAAFSIILIVFLCVAVFFRRTQSPLAPVFLLLGLGGLVLANYRTSILAIMPPLAIFLMKAGLRRVVPRQRAAAFIAMASVFLALSLLAADIIGNRFQDIATAFERGGALIKPPSYFTEEDKILFSGRAYIWSQYIDGWLNGYPLNRAFGFGADSWTRVFPVYAHNTFVSYLYEFGICGVAAIIYLLARNFRIAWQTKDSGRWTTAAAYLGFVILSLATMPLWSIEGNILFSLLLAHTWYAQHTAPSLNISPRTLNNSKRGMPLKQL